MIKFSEFYKARQLAKLNYTPEGEFYWLTCIEQSEEVIPGYRAGVILKRVSGVAFVHTTVELREGEQCEASFEPRVPGEAPRKCFFVLRNLGELPLAKSVFAVLYRKDVLAEDGDYIDADWAVVAHLTSSLDAPEPMTPDTMIANHFHLSGGTQTNMSPEEFEAALKESVDFWKNRAIASIGPL